MTLKRQTYKQIFEQGTDRVFGDARASVKHKPSKHAKGRTKKRKKRATGGS